VAEGHERVGEGGVSPHWRGVWGLCPFPENFLNLALEIAHSSVF